MGYNRRDFISAALTGATGSYVGYKAGDTPTSTDVSAPEPIFKLARPIDEKIKIKKDSQIYINRGNLGTSFEFGLNEGYENGETTFKAFFEYVPKSTKLADEDIARLDPKNDYTNESYVQMKPVGTFYEKFNEEKGSVRRISEEVRADAKIVLSVRLVPSSSY